MYNAKLAVAVKEYIERMAKNYKIKHGVSTDKQIDCPKCGLHRGLEFRGIRNTWGCLSCNYEFPSEIAPPDPFEFKKIMELKTSMDFIKKNRKLLD